MKLIHITSFFILLFTISNSYARNINCTNKAFLKIPKNNIIDFAHTAEPRNDSLNTRKLTSIIIGESVLYASTMYSLNNMWYKNYSQSKFHLFDDSKEWLQMDKAGHSYSAYYISQILTHGFKYAGINRQQSILYGASLGIFYIASIEIFDGFSSEWGASLSDIAYDIGGTALFSVQEYYFRNQILRPKFSYHQSNVEGSNTEIFGNTSQEHFLKNYNGQTYWLTANIKSIIKQDFIPKWLNIAVGYSADGMEDATGTIPQRKYLLKRKRQFFLSLDIDNSKIKTKSKILKSLFYIINAIKIPLPTIEYNSVDKFKLHGIYF